MITKGRSLVQTVNCLTSNVGHQNEADAPPPSKKSKNICSVNINGTSRTKSSQTLFLRLLNENVPCHVDICTGKWILP